MKDEVTDSLLEHGNLLVSQSVSLGNDWDEIDFCMKTPHDFNVKRLQRVSSRLDEIYTGMDSVVDNVHAVDLVLSLKVSIEPLFDVLDNGSPRIVIVDKVTETRGVNDCQSQTNTILLNVRAD